MRRRGCFMLLTMAALLVAGTSTAQERGHVAGVFGWTFGEQTAGLYGAQFGVGVGDAIQIVGVVERLNDVITGRYSLLLKDISEIGNVTSASRPSRR